MKYRKIKGTDLVVSVLGLGCSSYWAMDSTPETVAIDVLDVAYKNGINYFDTGSSYSGGNAEVRLGKFLSKIERTNVVISTKAGTSSVNMGTAKKDFHPLAIRKSVEDSVNRLGVDYIDILFLHGPSINDLTNELFIELELLKARGLIRYAGVHSSQEAVLIHASSIDCFSVFLSDYNLMRAKLDKTISLISEKNKGFIAATPLAQMLFTNKVFLPKNKKGLWYLARALKNRRKHLINGFRLRFASKIPDTSAEAVALGFVLDNANVSTAVFGTTKVDNVVSNISSINEKINEDIFKKIRKVKLLFDE